MIQRQDSVLFRYAADEWTLDNEQELLESETRWHYSQHFLAELKGEEVIEDMLSLAPSIKQRNILSSQLRDELRHTSLFEKQVGRLGFESRASRYAEGYSGLVKEQRSLSEKAFVFQILTESVSAAYCQWRLEVMKDPDLRAVDLEVGEDERRHLVMGKALLNITDPDERREKLGARRQRELVGRMNQICRTAIREDMVSALLPNFQLDSQTSASRLDSMIARSIIHELRDVQKNLLPEKEMNHESVES